MFRRLRFSSRLGLNVASAIDGDVAVSHYWLLASLYLPRSKDDVSICALKCAPAAALGKAPLAGKLHIKYFHYACWLIYPARLFSRLLLRNYWFHYYFFPHSRTHCHVFLDVIYFYILASDRLVSAAASLATSLSLRLLLASRFFDTQLSAPATFASPYLITLMMMLSRY